ncbi:sigma-54 interaction domain-containing protein [Pararobbsia alpina]|nr:sigma 54-interacting transcriptional regulator [Pararobbsia alpina]
MPIPHWFTSGQDESSFFRSLLDHVSDCLVAVDVNGRIVFINGPYCRLLGGNEEDFIGRHVTAAISPESPLHLVAQGSSVVVAQLLEVRGHRLITRQVPVYQDGRIVGAVGMALFSNLGLLKKAYALASDRSVAVENHNSGWVARFRESDLFGHCPRMEGVTRGIHTAARNALPVLIQGETGTGKELVANAIHTLSERADRPFVWVNCASIPENLIDAELFGYEGGAFTGARTRGKPGKFEIANGGTLFLDEIGDMPMNLQASLLRAINDQQIVRVGGLVPVPVDVRVVCATHRPLARLVKEGQFRQDLFYRLNILRVQLPALREREDLLFLVEQLLARLTRQHGRAARDLSRVEIERLRAHSWPGNVRELEAVLMRFLVSGELELDDASSQMDAAAPDQDGPFVPLHEHLQREKAKHMQRALTSANGDKDGAADLLGVSRSTLYRELKDIGQESQVP